MSADLYNLLHLLGVLLLMGGLGSLLSRYDKVGAGLHGAGLLLLLVSGFGMAAKLGHGFPWWIVAKLAIWLLLGAAVVIVKRRTIPVGAAWVVCLALAATAVLLGWHFGVNPN